MDKLKKIIAFVYMAYVVNKEEQEALMVEWMLNI